MIARTYVHVFVTRICLLACVVFWIFGHDGYTGMSERGDWASNWLFVHHSMHKQNVMSNLFTMLTCI